MLEEVQISCECKKPLNCVDRSIYLPDGSEPLTARVDSNLKRLGKRLPQGPHPLIFRVERVDREQVRLKEVKVVGTWISLEDLRPDHPVNDQRVISRKHVTFLKQRRKERPLFNIDFSGWKIFSPSFFKTKKVSIGGPVVIGVGVLVWILFF